MTIGLAYSTLYGRLKPGHQERRKAYKLDQNLEATEEKILVKKIEDMDRRDFPLRVSMVREMATKIIQQWKGIVQATIGKNWVSCLLEWQPQSSVPK